LKDYIKLWFNYIYFYRGLALLEGISDAKARSSKILSYTKTVATGRSLKEARRSAAGLYDQEKRKEKEEKEFEDARKAMAGES